MTNQRARKTGGFFFFFLGEGQAEIQDMEAGEVIFPPLQGVHK